MTNENKIDDGGPAFPNTPTTVKQLDQCNGMSLRDWFAGMAMQGYLATGLYCKHSEIVTVAEWSYEAADAMLKARSEND